MEKPPTLEEQGDSGSWAFSCTGVQPTFDPDEYWEGDTGDGALGSVDTGGQQQSNITV